jgi:hypothetical protein
MESDTLRKIQVKHGHGPTGSFKDRTIAEWLQVHNPTELDYQKVSFLFVFIVAYEGVIICKFLCVTVRCSLVFSPSR